MYIHICKQKEKDVNGGKNGARNCRNEMNEKKDPASLISVIGRNVEWHINLTTATTVTWD
jgi:hypothetical protein